MTGKPRIARNNEPDFVARVAQEAYLFLYPLVTMYDANWLVTANPINRYTLGDRSGLVESPDRSIVITIAHDAPAGDTTNWLPCPEGDFNLCMRLYGARREFFEGGWDPPGITRRAR